MTPVFVATHDNGVVRIYYRDPDGTLTQTGRFVADTIDPPTLAELVADLADSLHWNGNTTPAPAPTPPTPMSRVTALPAPKPKDDHRSKPRAGQAEVQHRREIVLGYLTANGDRSSSDVAAALFNNVPDSVGKARKLLDQLVNRGHATRIPPANPGESIRYRAIQ